ncbi:hypothetical protein [Tepidibacillus fermentans]|nr:hypothetical protein [Tepidibacillus fermentans]
MAAKPSSISDWFWIWWIIIIFLFLWIFWKIFSLRFYDLGYYWCPW